ncbi:putative Mg2+ transporter-C (MgtC) family protein [Rhizobium sp. BK251]|nr:putative Mg2+ transporter-C (MgtC) family protein [Rhizobium sp. BK251]
MIQANLLLATSTNVSGSMDILRYPLGVLTGVGFIGGGAILRRGDIATGVTTAATLWLITVIGLCFGGGQVVLGAIATIAAFLILSPFKTLGEKVSCEQKGCVGIKVPKGSPIPTIKSELPYRLEPCLTSIQHHDGQFDEIVYELHWYAANAQSAEAVVRNLQDRFETIRFVHRSTVS